MKEGIKKREILETGKFENRLERIVAAIKGRNKVT